MRDNLAALGSAVSRKLDQCFPGHDGGCLIVRIAGAKIRLPIAAFSGPRLPPERPRLSDMEVAILECLKELAGDAVLTSNELAARAGYVGNAGSWKRSLSYLTKAGEIENCRPGYRLRERDEKPLTLPAKG